MIRTVAIPTTGNRLGCSPGGGCCDECGGTNHAHLGSLRDTVCDSDQNCYDTTTGQLLSAPLTTGPGCAPGIPSCAASGAISATTLYIIGGLVLFGLLFSKGGK